MIGQAAGQAAREIVSGSMRTVGATILDVQQDFDRLIAEANRVGTAKVIVGFAVDNYRPDPELDGLAQSRQRSAIRQRQQAILGDLAGFSVVNVKQFEFIPFIAMELSAAGLTELRRSADVISIQEDTEQQASLLQSAPLIGAPTAWNAGFTGQGRTVAVLDTGVDKNHPFFNGRVVSEACYSTTSATTTSYCPGGVAESTVVNSGLNCNVNDVENCFHGTHVAGIAAGGHPQINGAGIAKNANIIAIQVFSRSTSCGSGTSPCTTSFSSDTIKGLERVYALRTTFNIDSVNLSLGGGRYFNQCDTEQSAYKTIFDTLRAANIASIVATGNDSYTDSVASPSCVSSAFAVGSTHDGDVLPVNWVSDFSNSAYFMHLLAPGELITSAYPGGFYYDTQGTSMATPMVAGAWAVMKHKFPTDTVTQTYTRLRYGGLPVLDNRNGLTKPRIRLDVSLNTSNVDPCGTVTPISIGTTNGALANTDCLMTLNTRADIYSFNGTAGQGVAITQTSTAFDTYLYLVSSTGAIVGENNNGGGGTNSRIPATSGFLTLPSTGTYYIYATSFNANTFGNYTLTLASNVVPPTANRPFDYDGDQRADISIFRPSNGDWYIQQSQAGLRGMRFGTSTDKLAPADYDGDGKTDIAVYRPSTGIWYIVRSSNGTVMFPVFGIAEDLPTPADYDGDGRADVGVFRPSSGTWYRQNSGNGTTFGQQFGANGDKPTIGDFDGDGKADLGVWRPSNGDWYHIRSSNGSVFGERFGTSTDKMVPADYDGDGKTDIAVYRPSTGHWFIRRSATATYSVDLFGASADIPAPGDYDGDGKADLCVFRPSEGNWYRKNSSNGSFFGFLFGANGDRPTPSAFN